MTGQVDEAVRAVDIVIAMLKATGNPKAAAVVAGLRTQLADMADDRDDWRNTAKVHFGLMRAHQADRDRLAGQVAAIRALCDATGSGFPYVQVRELRAVVASSPTTPEAKK